MHEQEVQEGVTESPQWPDSSDRWLRIAAVLLLCTTLLGFFLLWRARRNVRELTLSRDEMRATLEQTRSQLDTLNDRLNSMAAAQAAAQTAPPAALGVAPEAGNPPASIAPTRPIRRSPVHSKTSRQPVEDPRWRQFQSQLAEQQKQIQATQDSIQKTRSELEGNLTSTRDELNGSIARTHEELVELRKRGERNYFEFDLTKSKQFQHVGSISLSLRKADTKHKRYDIVALVDDFELSKKQVNLYEPVFFFPQGSQQPVQLVVNRIDKNEVQGYVSEPKYRPTESAATKTAAPPSQAAATAPAAGVNLARRPETSQ
jgi:hypothetical protein